MHCERVRSAKLSTFIETESEVVGKVAAVKFDPNRNARIALLHYIGAESEMANHTVLAPAQTFCRKFLWHELMLWPEDMPPHALVILSDADDLVPSALVAKHISDAHTTATVMYHPTAGHGGFLVDLPWQRQMVQVGCHLILPQP